MNTIFLLLLIYTSNHALATTLMAPTAQPLFEPYFCIENDKDLTEFKIDKDIVFYTEQLVIRSHDNKERIIYDEHKFNFNFKDKLPNNFIPSIIMLNNETFFTRRTLTKNTKPVRLPGFQPIGQSLNFSDIKKDGTLKKARFTAWVDKKAFPIEVELKPTKTQQKTIKRGKEQSLWFNDQPVKITGKLPIGLKINFDKLKNKQDINETKARDQILIQYQNEEPLFIGYLLREEINSSEVFNSNSLPRYLITQNSLKTLNLNPTTSVTKTSDEYSTTLLQKKKQRLLNDCEGILCILWGNLKINLQRFLSSLPYPKQVWREYTDYQHGYFWKNAQVLHPLLHKVFNERIQTKITPFNTPTVPSNIFRPKSFDLEFKLPKQFRSQSIKGKIYYKINQDFVPLKNARMKLASCTSGTCKKALDDQNKRSEKEKKDSKRDLDEMILYNIDDKPSKSAVCTSITRYLNKYVSRDKPFPSKLRDPEIIRKLIQGKTSQVIEFLKKDQNNAHHKRDCGNFDKCEGHLKDISYFAVLLNDYKLLEYLKSNNFQIDSEVLFAAKTVKMFRYLRSMNIELSEETSEFKNHKGQERTPLYRHHLKWRNKQIVHFFMKKLIQQKNTKGLLRDSLSLGDTNIVKEVLKTSKHWSFSRMNLLSAGELYKNESILKYLIAYDKKNGKKDLLMESFRRANEKKDLNLLNLLIRNGLKQEDIRKDQKLVESILPFHTKYEASKDFINRLKEIGVLPLPANALVRSSSKEAREVYIREGLISFKSKSSLSRLLLATVSQRNEELVNFLVKLGLTADENTTKAIIEAYKNRGKDFAFYILDRLNYQKWNQATDYSHNIFTQIYIPRNSTKEINEFIKRGYTNFNTYCHGIMKKKDSIEVLKIALKNNISLKPNSKCFNQSSSTILKTIYENYKGHPDLLEIIEESIKAGAPLDGYYDNFLLHLVKNDTPPYDFIRLALNKGARISKNHSGEKVYSFLPFPYLEARKLKKVQILKIFDDHLAKKAQ